MHNVDLSCFCGKVKGNLEVVSNTKAFHVNCLCKDCQKFACHLGTEDKILDEYGASDLFQTYPKYFKLTQGQENLSCLKLKEGGLLRWYTSCCNTPVANTIEKAKMPFAGISVKFMHFDSEEEKLEVLGPVIMKAFAKYSLIAPPKDAHDTFPRTFMPKIIKFMFVGFVKGMYKPSVFYEDGVLTSEPKLIK